MRTLPNHVINTIRAALDPYTAQIIVEYKGRVGPQGSGVFFAVDDYRFLVTAAHVVTSAKGANFLLPSDIEERRAFPLTGSFLYSKSSQLDLAVYRLSNEELAHLPGRKFAARMSDTHFDPVAHKGIVAIYGLLAGESAAWKATDLNPSSPVATAVLVTDFADADLSPEYFDPQLHWCCEASKLWATDNDGQRDVPKSFEGLSGAAAWAIPGDPWNENCTFHSPIICGIQSSVITTAGGKRDYCKIIKWAAVFELLKACYPTIGEVAESAKSVCLIKRN